MNKLAKKVSKKKKNRDEIVSTENLYHYTNKFEYIKSIIQNGFRVSMCKENYYYINSGFSIDVPMVCFTDLPTNINIKHIKRYGNYAIGVTKQWAENNNIAPILYLRKNSAFTSTIKELYKIAKARNYFMQNKLLAFCKPFCAKYWQKNSKRWSKSNRRFYDEREWRYVPQAFLDNNRNLEFDNLKLNINTDIAEIYIPKNKQQEAQELRELGIDESKIKFR